jgi:hypothetical protein
MALIPVALEALAIRIMAFCVGNGIELRHFIRFRTESAKNNPPVVCRADVGTSTV